MPQNHCLDQDTVFAAEKGWTRRHIYVSPAKIIAPPNASGEANVISLKDGAEMTTQHFWTTRPARRDELAVGQLAIMVHKKDSDGSYRAPKNRDEAHGTWWMSRIVSIAPLAQAGEVIVAGGYRINANAVRLVLGDQSATVSVSGTEDQHYLKTGHWIIGDKKLPERRHAYVAVGAPITVPSAETKGDGQFINAKDGHTTWTRHAWRTRPATKADIKLGTYVFMVHKKDQDGNYRAPTSRAEAITSTWWVAKVTDTSELYKNVVQVAGDYRVRLDGARVIIK